MDLLPVHWFAFIDQHPNNRVDDPAGTVSPLPLPLDCPRLSITDLQSSQPRRQTAQP